MNKKILVVDDTSSIREALKKVLREASYEVLLAACGREGIEKFNAEMVDLLIVDINLPDMSGWEVFETLTRINPFLPVIVITGEELHRNLAAWGGSGALLEKPLNVPVLMETVQGLLGESPASCIHELAGRGSDIRFARAGTEGRK